MSTTSQAKSNANKEGMVLIPGGAFSMGGDDDQAWRDEYPKHEVVIDSFWMDVHEVTNAQFAAFVEATGYVTTAEKAVDWEEIKKELPPEPQNQTRVNWHQHHWFLYLQTSLFHCVM
jgi:formylglycine-generating enzyme required for sulfatase activity